MAFEAKVKCFLTDFTGVGRGEGTVFFRILPGKGRFPAFSDDFYSFLMPFFRVLAFLGEYSPAFFGGMKNFQYFFLSYISLIINYLH